MRISKFRGYDLAGKRWVFGGYWRHEEIMPAPGQTLPESDVVDIITNDSAADAQQPRELQAIVVAHGSVGEYTGMHLADGREIYENDIFEYVPLNKEDRPGIARGRVSYDDKTASFVIVDGLLTYKLFSWAAWQGRKAILIGNTYDNPEMLGETK